MRKLITILIALIIALVMVIGAVITARCQCFNVVATCWDEKNKCKEDKGYVVINTDSTIVINTRYERILLNYVKQFTFRRDRYYEIETGGNGKTFIWVSRYQIIYIRPKNKTTWYNLR